MPGGYAALLSQLAGYHSNNKPIGLLEIGMNPEEIVTKLYLV